jgi:hypothetical protein
MLISAEQWRKDENVDEIAKYEFPTVFLLIYSEYLRFSRGFDFPEKEALDEFYPQYYHKCDKACRCLHCYHSTGI